MPLTRQVYIALTIHAFYDFICNRIENVHEFYISHAKSIQNFFEAFQNSSPLKLVLDGKEKIEIPKTQRYDMPPQDLLVAPNTRFDHNLDSDKSWEV